jgi:hypothetical protein
MKFTPEMITKEMKDAARLVLMSMAYTETIKTIVMNYRQKVLADMQPRVDPQWGKGKLGLEDRGTITDPDDMYLAGDKIMDEYDRKCRIERDKAGLKVEKDEYCPLLVAEDLQRKAEHAMVAALQPLTGVTLELLLCSTDGLENLKKYLDLTLRLITPLLDEKSGADMLKRAGRAMREIGKEA